jgi:hypothetical protein
LLISAIEWVSLFALGARAWKRFYGLRLASADPLRPQWLNR